MSVLAIIAIVFAVLVVTFFVGGYIAARRRSAALSEDLYRRVAEADRALAAAQAQDRGWDKALLEEAARAALQTQRPEFRYDQLFLVQVEDRPGKDQDRAHMTAVGDDGDATHVVLTRHGGEWAADRIE
jgi:hypothetical protein